MRSALFGRNRRRRKFLRIPKQHKSEPTTKPKPKPNKSNDPSVSVNPMASQTETIIVAKPGERGKQGPMGPAGPMGPRGPRGAPGIKGDRGQIGARGPQGVPGIRGEKGDAGNNGERGEKGERGIRGEKGERGTRGEKGERGIRGEKGERGIRGEKGERGIRGEKGERGDSAWGDLVSGLPTTWSTSPMRVVAPLEVEHNSVPKMMSLTFSKLLADEDTNTCERVTAVDILTASGKWREVPVCAIDPRSGVSHPNCVPSTRHGTNTLVIMLGSIADATFGAVSGKYRLRIRLTRLVRVRPLIESAKFLGKGCRNIASVKETTPFSPISLTAAMPLDFAMGARRRPLMIGTRDISVWTFGPEEGVFVPFNIPNWINTAEPIILQMTFAAASPTSDSTVVNDMSMRIQTSPVTTTKCNDNDCWSKQFVVAVPKSGCPVTITAHVKFPAANAVFGRFAELGSSALILSRTLDSGVFHGDVVLTRLEAKVIPRSDPNGTIAKISSSCDGMVTPLSKPGSSVLVPASVPASVMDAGF